MTRKPAVSPESSSQHGTQDMEGGVPERGEGRGSGGGVVCGVWSVVWCVVCGVWCVVCGVSCVVCGVWCVFVVFFDTRRGACAWSGHVVGSRTGQLAQTEKQVAVVLMPLVPFFIRDG